MECSERVEASVSLQPSNRQHLQAEKVQAEQLLLEMLQLRSKLVETTAMFCDHHIHYDRDSSDIQMRYIKLHSELDHVRRKMATLSSEKVLALSVREAIEHTVASLLSGCATSGMDIGRHGGSSTDGTIIIMFSSF